MVMSFFTFIFPYIFCISATGFMFYARDRNVVSTKKKRQAEKSLWQYLFPREAFGTKSAKIDYILFFLNGFVFTPLFFVLWGLIIYTLHIDTGFVAESLKISFDKIDLSPINFFMALLVFIMVDATNAFLHYLSHKSSFLWQFHKVHHNATSLNMFTADRHHPVSIAFVFFVSQIVIVTFIRLLAWLMPIQFDAVMVWAILSLMTTLLKPIDMLKHVHVWMSWGPLNYVFQSPAMHQIHHSVDPKFHHKNFGAYFSVWDQLLGTLCVPDSKMDITYGLKVDIDGSSDSESLKYSLLNPFKRVFAKFKKK